MARNLFRKRHVPLQSEAEGRRAEATSSTFLNGRYVRWLQKGFLRRTRLLFALLRQYPIVILFLFLVIWVGFRLLSHSNLLSFQSKSNLQFQREITKSAHVSFVDRDLLDNFDRRLQSVSNFRPTPQGIFMDVQLEGAKKGVVKVYAHQTSQNDSSTEDMPQLHQLAKILHLSHGFMPSYYTRLPVVLQEPLADRHLTKALSRACGFRSPSKVPDGETVAAYIIPVEASTLRVLSALHMPAIEPYDWVSNLPTSQECGRSIHDQPNNKTERNRCRRLTEVMMVMYLAGCAPPDNDAFVLWTGDVGEDRELFKMAFPWGCFGRYEDNSVLLDIVLSFVRKTCSLPSGLLALIKRLADLGWGVGKRAEILVERLVLLNYEEDGICRTRGWTFYQGSVKL